MSETIAVRKIKVSSENPVELHTGCSQPIGSGTEFVDSDFVVVSGKCGEMKGSGFVTASDKQQVFWFLSPASFGQLDPNIFPIDFNRIYAILWNERANGDSFEPKCVEKNSLYCPKMI